MASQTTPPKQVATDPRQLSMFDAMKLLSFSDDRLFVSSLDVAERFDKAHKNVLAAIQTIECSEEFNRLNFKPIEFKDARGRMQPAFNLTRDGFSLLVMGFTGKEAMYWKERYIQAFNLMEAELLKRSVEHAEARGRSKEIRVQTTDAYRDHGATEWYHYSDNTDAIYVIMFGGRAAEIRKKWNLPAKANVRNHLSTEQLHHIISIENSITLQLETRKVTNPKDQLVIIRHVTRTYKTMLDTPLPVLGS
jgi:Rha family phage regulatory protein